MRVRPLALGAALLALSGLAGDASARPLASIRERGTLLLCANPNALPYSAKSGDRQGIQLELGKALAEQLGVGLEVGWVVFPNQISRVDCDIILDSIVNDEVQAERRVRVSRPYQRSGVVLAFRPGLEPAASVAGLPPGLRVGAMVGSIARLNLAKQGVSTIPYTFEDEMLEALAAGELDAAAVSPTPVGFHNLMHPDSPVATAAAFAAVPDLNWSLAVGMRRADDALVDMMNEAVARLLADGTIDRIYRSYGVTPVAPEP